MNHSLELIEIIPRYKISNWIVFDYFSKSQARDSKLRSLYSGIHATRFSEIPDFLVFQIASEISVATDVVILNRRLLMQ